MSITAFLLILVSVFLHAGWNFLSKANRPSTAFFMLANATVAAAASPVIFFAEIKWCQIPLQFWLLLAASIFFEVLYAVGLANAYKKQDISIAYPLARAMPVLLVAMTTLLFGIGKNPPLTAWAGFAVVAAGCVILPQENLRALKLQSFIRSISGAIFLAAIGTTGYTVIDKIATAGLMANSVSGENMTLCVYLFLMEAGLTAALTVLVLISRREQTELAKSFKSAAPYVCGLFSGAAYLLILAAMNFVSNVSYLQAFRQMSLPLGVAMGVVFLHEKLSLPKLIGVTLIVGGLVLSVF